MRSFGVVSPLGSFRSVGSFAVGSLPPGSFSIGSLPPGPFAVGSAGSLLPLGPFAVGSLPPGPFAVGSAGSLLPLWPLLIGSLWPLLPPGSFRPLGSFPSLCSLGPFRPLGSFRPLAVVVPAYSRRSRYRFDRNGAVAAAFVPGKLIHSALSLVVIGISHSDQNF